MTRIRPGNPILPGNREDRTGTAGLRRRALAAIRRRFDALAVEVLAIFGRIRVIGQNDASNMRTIYALTPEELAATAQALQDALDRWIAEGRDTRHILWWEPFQAEAAQLGTAQAAGNLTQLSTAYAASRTLQQVIFSEPYRNRVAMAQIKSYEHWTSMSVGMRSELSQLIGRAVADGKNPRDIRREIMDRLEVSKSSAMQYAQTDLTDTLRQARLAESENASEELGLQIGQLWTSSLIPTTRPWHASRNGRVYTPAQVRAFYSERGNRYNCFLPGTLVQGRFVAGTKARYKGPVVTLVTALGRELTVTANHPVMANGRLVPAAKVKEGDDLVAYLGQPKDPARVADLHGDLVGARIEDVFGALVETGHLSNARVSGVDFHGDALLMEPDIQVVRAEGVLTVALDASGANLLDDLALIHPDAPALSGGLQPLLGVFRHAPSRGHVGGGGNALAAIVAHLVEPSALGLLEGSIGQPEIAHAATDVAAVKPSALADRQDGLPGRVRSVERCDGLHSGVLDPLSEPELASVESLHQRSVTHADAARDLVQRFAGLAAIDQVVQVIRGQYDGHVFDLQELSGLMLGSGIAVSNCYCAVTEALLDASGKPILTDNLKAAMVKEREAWQKVHDAP